MQAFRSRLTVVCDQVGLDGFIFIKERIHVDYKVFDDRVAKHRFNRHLIANIAHQDLASQAVAAIDAHGIRTTDTMCAGAAVCERAIHCPFDGVHGVQQAVDGIDLHAIIGPVWLLILFGVEASDTHQHIHGLPP